ncbi:MAG: gluconokinase [Pyrinomonadaceae bacterium]|nr:gluconokinase [Pyrinomonadaceae bacterium]
MNAVLTKEARKDSDSQTTAIVLALDISTSSVRAALYDEAGREVPNAEAHLVRELHTTADGGAELDAQEAVEQVVSTIDALLSRDEARRARIELVAVSCFWHSLVGVDTEGRAVTPVLGWADMRAGAWAEELRQQLDERAVHARTGCRFHPSYWPAKLRWLQEERSVVARAAQQWMSLGEFLLLTFFGETATSVAMASGTGLLNFRSCVWDEELCERLGLSAKHLPKIAEEGQTFTRLKESFARRWPQLREARWFPVMPDGAANNIGAGCTSAESASLMVGTSGAMRVLCEAEPPLTLPPELWCYRVDRKRILLGGALSDGGGLYAWMRETLALGSETEAIERALAAMGADAHGLTLLPCWAGERSTGWHTTTARGAMLGLTMHTDALHILRAAMEAIAYRFALIADALHALVSYKHVIASGGALDASPAWTQIIADVLGRTLLMSGVREASTRGAVLLALEAAGQIESITHKSAPVLQAYEPEMKRHELYRAAIARQQKYYELLIE